MNLIRWAVDRAVARRMHQVERAGADPGAAQRKVLRSLVRRARFTEWGLAHRYGRIRSEADFRAAVPVGRYEDQAPWWHRSFEGCRDVTWPGHIPWFALTSGTTSGASKAMPVSREAIRGNIRSGIALLGFLREQAPDADLLSGRTLYFGGCTRLEERGRCLVGDASGIHARHVPRLAARYRLPEPEVAGLRDWERKVGTICRRYLRAPVRAVVGLPSWTLLLFHRLVEEGRRRIGREVSTVADVWPDLSVFVHYGMSAAPYRERILEIAGRPLLLVDTYSSSEGGLNAVQDRRDDPGMRLEVDGGVYFEFVPAGEIEDPEPTRLAITEVETGRPYAVLLSTNSGIWAYDVGDVVRFTSLTPPRIVFATRTRLQLNTFGEHVIQEDLEAAVAEACRATGARIRDYTVDSLLPGDDDPRGRHLWLVEFEGEPPSLERFAARLDARIAKASDDYATHRSGDFGLAPPEIRVLAPGTCRTWMARHGKLGGQHKLPRICLSPSLRRELEEISRSRSGDRAP